MTGRLNRASGLFAQPMLLRLLDHEAAQALRHHTPISIVRFSFQLGEDLDAATLRSAQQVLSQVLNTQLRAVDLPGHLEEDYLIVLPITGENGARALAARLVRAVADVHQSFTSGNITPIFCCGVAYHPGGQTCDGNILADQAAEALRLAQSQGPNSIVSYSEMSTE